MYLVHNSTIVQTSGYPFVYYLTLLIPFIFIDIGDKICIKIMHLCFISIDSSSINDFFTVFNPIFKYHWDLISVSNDNIHLNKRYYYW